MGEVYDTGGNIVKGLAPQCSCGLTGGCEKCQPFTGKENLELDPNECNDPWHDAVSETGVPGTKCPTCRPKTYFREEGGEKT